MEKAKLSAFQLFALLVLFQLGTAVVVGFGVNAGKDGWLAVLLGMGLGLIFFLIYYTLFKLYPKPLTSLIQAILGKYVGGFVGVTYITYFLYGAARDLRDVGDLLVTSVYIRTPLIIIMLLHIIAISYVLYKGITTLGRISEIYIMVIILLGLFGNLFVIVSGTIDLNNLRPLLDEGWAPVLSTAYPLTSVFPFGELICFTVLFPYVEPKKVILPIGLSSICICGIILAYTTALNIAVLGVDIAETSTFPLFTTVSLVNIYEFIQRIDAVVVLTLFVGAFFKTSLFFYAALISTAELFKVDFKKLVLPFAVIILLLATVIAKDFAEHILEGQESLYSIHALFAVFIPFFLLIFAYIKKMVNNERKPMDQTS
ncbi:GerAB/ArcD/ProY family transporter [Halalkalibacter flavus]|uniref:GerAB/ArcD/ProY family transporter n=1 Tax=Halalkalibacter flavus TaxID=3090668 RepID=UPI002FC9728E